jgi:general secretion pathway protein G
MNTRAYDRVGRPGFSLLELMLVLAIIGVLTAIAAVSLSGAGERAKRRATIASMSQVVNALQNYKLDHNLYPANLDALRVGTTAYLDQNKQIADGWKQPFLYAAPGTSGHEFDLYSKGGDLTFGTQDDLDWWRVKDE